MKQNNYIEGIKIPNQMTPIKLFQHGDDCTAITTNLNLYDYLINEFRLFDHSSGLNGEKKKKLKF